MTRFVFDPGDSQVWIDGSSSVHPIRATATGVSGWFELAVSEAGIVSTDGFAGEVRVAVDRLASGNPLVDRETRRRIDAARFPEIIGTATSAELIAPDRLALSGNIEFRGETSSVAGELTVAFVHDRVVAEGVQTFDVRDWGLRLPRLGFLRVHADVRVRVRLVGAVAD